MANIDNQWRNLTWISEKAVNKKYFYTGILVALMTIWYQIYIVCLKKVVIIY